MAVDHEPRLVPPQSHTPRSIFDNSELLETDCDGHGNINQIQAGGEKSNGDGKKSKISGSGSHNNRLRVSAWEGTLPRLGFGFIDVTSLVDYEKRPKTPDASFLGQPISPTHLPTPPCTPHDKPLGLSAGIASALSVSADITGSVSSRSTVTASAIQHSAGSRNQSTLQSSPPAPFLASVSKISSDGQSQLREQSDSVNSDKIHANGRNSTLSTTPTRNLLKQETPQATTLSRSTVGRREASPSLISEQQSHSNLSPPRSPESVVNHTLKPLGQCDKNEAKSPDGMGLTSYRSPLCAPNNGSALRTMKEYETAFNTRNTNRYLEILRTAVRKTPPSREPAEHTSRQAKTNESGTQQTTQPRASRAQVATPEKDRPITYQQISTALPGQVQQTSGEALLISSSSSGSLLKPQVHQFPSILTSTFASPAPQVTRLQREECYTAISNQEALVRSRDNDRGALSDADPDDDDDEDDDSGGCSVSPDLKLLHSRGPFIQEPPRFSRKKSSQAEKLIQDAFKAQVKEAAMFSAQFTSTSRLTKDQKFDNLIAKLQAKKLLHHDSVDQRDLYVFVDMSNIFIGFQDTAKTSQGFPASARVTWSPFSFEHLAFALERGRKTAKRKLAGSVRQAHQMHNLPLHVLEAQSYGYETKILHQVVKLDPTQPFLSSPATSGDEAHPGVLCPRTKLGEQGVDEALHLAMQDSILDAQGSPGIMVLATGDAKPAEYSDGFAHYAIKALKHGWQVEVVSWRKCLSSEWKKSPFKDKYAEQFRIILLDDFFDEIHADWIGGSPAVLARA